MSNSDRPAPIPGAEPAPASSAFRRVAPVLLALLVLAALAGAAWLLGKSFKAASASIILPTGERISVRSASYGTNHPAAPHFPLEHRLPNLVRTWVQRALGLPPGPPPVKITPDPALVVWLGVSQPGAARTGPFPWLHLTLATTGDESKETSLRGPERDLALIPGTDRVPVDFNSFPRRAARLALVVSQQLPDGSYSVLGTLPFPNPLPTTYPTWAPDPVPIRRQSGSVECSVQGFIVGTGRGVTHGTLRDGRSRVSFGRAGAQERAGAALFIDFRDRDQETNHWSVGSLTVVDATGNRCPATSQSATHPGNRSGAMSYAWSPLLWENEVWELQFEAKRDPASRFLPEERVVFDEVPLPEIGATNRPATTARAQGVDLELRTLIRREPNTGNSWSDSDLTRVVLRATGLTNGLYVDLLAASDETGARYTPASVSRATGSATDPVELGFAFRDIPTSATRLHLELAVHRGVPITFRLDPRVAITNELFGWH